MAKSNNKKICVLVTGTGGASTGEGIVKTLRLAKTPYRIVAVDALPVSYGFFDADKHYQVPLASDPHYLETIMRICAKEKVNVIIPGVEPELKKLSENRKMFEEKGIVLLINNHEVIDLCMDKWKTYEFLKKNGFHCPDSYLIETETQARDLLPELEKKLPVIIKPVHGGGSSVNTFIAQDKEELAFFMSYVLKQGATLLVQECVGTPHEEYTVGVLTNYQGTLVGSIAMRRQILSGLSSKLKIKNRRPDKLQGDVLAISSGYSQGTIDDYPDVRKASEQIALKLGSTGPVNIQGRNTPNGFYVFEINPRFSSTSIMRAMVGFNEVEILLQEKLLGKKPKTPIRYKKGVLMRGLREAYMKFTK